MKQRASGYLEEYKGSKSNFIPSIWKAFRDGRLDHNFIRKTVINCFNSNDQDAIILGALLLQLDNDDIGELLSNKLA